MANVFRTSALILRHSTDREQDRMLVVLTPTYGKMQIRARGTKKSVSKLGGSLEPLTEVDLTLANGRTVDVVTGSVILRRWPELRSDLVGSVSAQWLLELVERVTKPNQPEQGLYPLVGELLDDMKAELNWPFGRRWLALLRRGWLVLQHEGFTPALDRCGLCHRRLDSSEAAMDRHHGLIHRAERQTEAFDLVPQSIAYLAAGQAPGDMRQVFGQVQRMVEVVLAHVLEQPLRSDQVFRSVVRLERLSARA